MLPSQGCFFFKLLLLEIERLRNWAYVQAGSKLNVGFCETVGDVNSVKWENTFGFLDTDQTQEIYFCL